VKVDIKDLKKAIAWFEANTKADTLTIYNYGTTDKIFLETFDKYEASVQITIFESGTMMPKITKTEIL
jgi:hypothetical protein